jgi:hypothetical protein
VGVALQPVAVKCLGVKPFETVEQLPSPPLALVEVLGVCAAEELLLQLYVSAAWKPSLLLLR